LERKYSSETKYDYPKRFFFWGIFKDKKRLEQITGYQTYSFKDSTLRTHLKGKFFKIPGKLVEFDVSDKDFYIILGKLALVEIWNYYLFSDMCYDKEIQDWKKVLFYVPVNLKEWDEFLIRKFLIKKSKEVKR